MFLHKQSLLSYELIFFQPKSQILLRQNVFILKVFILIINQLLSAANAKDINTILQIALKLQVIIDLKRRASEGDPKKNKRDRTWAGSDVFSELFLYTS